MSKEKLIDTRLKKIRDNSCNLWQEKKEAVLIEQPLLVCNPAKKRDKQFTLFFCKKTGSLLI
jgi:hypothetical protein